MILENKGLVINNYFLPPFTLNEGEIVVVNLFGGSHFQPIKTYLTAIFTGQVSNEKIHLYTPIKAVEAIVESKWRSFFYPLTVGEYLRKFANSNSQYVTQIYTVHKWIKSQTKLNRLPGNPKKQLSLFATLSLSKHIVFDLAGLDPIGAGETYELVKASVRKGGSAILLDWSDEMSQDCTTFVVLQRLA